MRVWLTSWAVREAGVPTRSPESHQLARIAVQVFIDTSGNGYPGWHSGRFVGTREGVLDVRKDNRQRPNPQNYT